MLRIFKAGETRELLTLEEGFRACEAAYRYYGEAGDVLSHPSSVMPDLPKDPTGQGARIQMTPSMLSSKGCRFVISLWQRRLLTRRRRLVSAKS